MVSRVGEYIRIDGSLSRLQSYRHWLQPNTIQAHNKIAPAGKVYVIKCPDCGSSDFTDDGRYRNEYSCVCCVESYVEVYFSYE